MPLDQVTGRPTAAKPANAYFAKLWDWIRTGREYRGRALLNSAALLTLAASAIHFSVAPEHFVDFAPYGVFFVCLGLIQVVLAAAILLRPNRRLFVIAASGTLAVIGLWLASRTVGLPIAPVPGRPEDFGFTDVVCTLLEAISLVLFLFLIRSPRRSRRGGPVGVALTTAPGFLFAALAGFLGVGAALNPMEAAFNVAPAIPGQQSISVARLVAAPGDEPVKAFTLTAGVTKIGSKEAWPFNGTVPGPELRVTQGDRVRVTLVNRLSKATSIHWHGMRVPGEVDGVAGITQNAVRPGASYVYEFIANDAGTFWYHSHQEPNDQIPRGLLGPIIVEPQALPDRRDYILLIHTLSDGSSIAVNGSASLHLDASPGDTVRLRLINGAQPGLDQTVVQTPVLLGAPYRISALDGHDLNGPQLLGPVQIPLGMGQRADLVFTMPASGAVRLAGIKGASAPLPFGASQPTASVTIGAGQAPATVDTASLPRFDLTRYGRPAADLVAEAARFDLTRRIVLGGAPSFRNGGFDFAQTFDGHASPLVPPIRIREGELVHLQVVNSDTTSSHPIHIHGHVFSVLALNGVPISGSPVHVDTILVRPNETWDVAFKADNPGIWMLHCHVLAHAASGMSMTVNYEGVSTPFSMGSRSGNVPE